MSLQALLPPHAYAAAPQQTCHTYTHARMLCVVEVTAHVHDSPHRRVGLLGYRQNLNQVRRAGGAVPWATYSIL